MFTARTARERRRAWAGQAGARASAGLAGTAPGTAPAAWAAAPSSAPASASALPPPPPLPAGWWGERWVGLRSLRLQGNRPGGAGAQACALLAAQRPGLQLTTADAPGFAKEGSQHY
jgi:hypothetical protein